MKKTDLPLEFDCDQLRDDTSNRFYCDHCKETVTNISKMSRSTANTFLEKNPDACIRFYSDSDGDLIFATPVSRLMSQLRGAQKLVSAAALVPLLTIVACEESEEVRAESEACVELFDDESSGAASLNIKGADGLPKKTRSNSSYDGNVTKPGPAIGVDAAIEHRADRTSELTLREALEDHSSTKVSMGRRKRVNPRSNLTVIHTKK